MTLPMTRLEGVPNRSDIIPGMAYFQGTGPEGKTCGDCKHRGYVREARKGVWSDRLQEVVFRHYRVQKCAMFRKMVGGHGANVKADYPSCKYYEPK